MGTYLGQTGLAYLWNKIKSYVGSYFSSHLDNVPTENSTNTVTSEGIYNALDGKVDKVIDTYTFSDIIALSAASTTNTSQAAGTFYFIYLKPQDYDKPFKIKYRIKTYVPSNANYYTLSIVELNIFRSSVVAYSIFNSILNTSYKPVYYYTTYPAINSTEATETGHVHGFSLYNATNPMNSGLKRSGTVEILEVEGGTYEWIETPTLYADLPHNGTTYHGSIINYNGYSQGLQETGDTNDTSIAHNIRIATNVYSAHSVLYRYLLLVTKDEENLVPITNASNKSTLLTKTLTTESFNPFGQIWYYATTTAVSAGGTISGSYLYNQYSSINGNYSFNISNSSEVVNSFVTGRDVYLVCIPQSDGMVKLRNFEKITPGSGINPKTNGLYEKSGDVYSVTTDTTVDDTKEYYRQYPLSQTLPTTEDGYVYIRLGKAVDTTKFSLEELKPVYYYKDGNLRLWINNTDKQDVISDLESIRSGAAAGATAYQLPNGGTSTQFIKADGSVDSNTYLTSFTETDPVYLASAASGITSTDISNWNGKADASDLDEGFYYGEDL